MRTIICTAVLFLFTSLHGLGQASTPAAKPPVRTPAAAAASAEPTAIIHTSAGDLHCTLFEKQTPVTVENFIGLSDGTKDWKNPVSGASKKGVPLYDGTIFHRVIPEFMIQGGDPAGNGSGDPGYKFKDEIGSSLSFDRPGRLAMANSGPRHQRLAVLYHRGTHATSQRTSHHFRPVRRCRGRTRQADCPHGQRSEQ